MNNIAKYSALVLVALLWSGVARAQIIKTVAGTGVAGLSGNGGPATAAQIKTPAFMSMSPSGEIYLLDNTARRIRKISTDGVISTFAGTGVLGNTGDNGPATDATFELPNSVTFDDIGNVYIASTGANVIRKVNTAGIITTIAGTGATGYGGDEGPATAAVFNYLNFIKFHNGNLFIADMNNNRVRVIVYNPLAIDDIGSVPLQIAVYPNPASGTIHISAAKEVNANSSPKKLYG